jgi:hypothetical protein
MEKNILVSRLENNCFEKNNNGESSETLVFAPGVAIVLISIAC